MEGNYKDLCSQITLQSASEGCFKDLVSNVFPLINFIQFSRATTNYERFKICAEYCWEDIGAELVFRGKNEEDGMRKLQEGNYFFQQKQYRRALLAYCQSIIRCPAGQNLATVYANRSALFQKLGKYNAAVQDIELAISYQYPDEQRHKLYQRMADCHLRSGRFDKARISLNLSKHFATKHDKNDNDFNKKLQKLENKISSANKTQSDEAKGVPEGEITNKSETFPVASEKLGVTFDETRGRYVTAVGDLKSGEQILKEDPYAACLHVERLGTFCLHCFARLEAAVACETCSHVAFCSKKCRNDAQKYHQYECRMMGILLGSGMSTNCYLALRVITMNPVSYFKEIYSTLRKNSKAVLLNAKNQYESSSYLSMYNLSGLEEKRTPFDFFQRSVMAVFLVKCLRLTGYFDINLYKNKQPTEIEYQVGSLILRNLQVIQFNAYEVAEFLMQRPNEFKTSKTSHVGLAIYCTAAFFNHSCAPNVVRYFKGKTMMMDSLQPISCGEAIHDNYGPNFINMKKPERRHRLQGRYWFDCQCVACLRDWCKLSDIPEPSAITPANEDEAKVLKRIKELEAKYYDDSINFLDSGEINKALSNYYQFLDGIRPLLEGTSLQPYKNQILAMEAVKLSTASKGSVHIIENEIS